MSFNVLCSFFDGICFEEIVVLGVLLQDGKWRGLVNVEMREILLYPCVVIKIFLLIFYQGWGNVDNNFILVVCQQFKKYLKQ